MKEMVDAYNNVKAVLVTDGLSKQEITLPLREPIGRKFFTEELQSYDDDHVRGISRSHFRIDRHGAKFWITDLDSTNGTYIDGMKIPPVFAQQLPENSNPTLRIGNILLQISVNPVR